MQVISEKERLRLRALAMRQLELSHCDYNKRLYKDWEAHGRMDLNARPMITIEFLTFCDEFITPMLECESESARSLEWQLLHNIIPVENFGDDTIIRDYFGYSEGCNLLPFGLTVKRKESGGLGHSFIPQVCDLDEDFHLLGKSVIYTGGTNDSLICFVHDIIGDILPVKKIGNPIYSGFLMSIVHIMGMDNMYTAMHTTPDLFSKMCSMLADDYIEMIEQMESKGLFMATNGDIGVCQGTMCFTDALPFEGTNLKASQIWGYMDAQEAQGISPNMYHDLVYPHYKRISERFGLLSYGCCEAVDRFWEDISAYKNLKKLSISNWTDEKFISEKLRDLQDIQGRKIVYHRKPSPNYLGVSRELDENAVRAHIRKSVQYTTGLTLEITQRDVYTVHCSAAKVARYVQIIREECEKKK